MVISIERRRQIKKKLVTTKRYNLVNSDGYFPFALLNHFPPVFTLFCALEGVTP